MTVLPVQVEVLLTVAGLISSGQLRCLWLLAYAPGVGSKSQV